jgi:hypothetical protein
MDEDESIEDKAMQLIIEACGLMNWHIAIAEDDMVEGFVIGSIEYIQEIVGDENIDEFNIAEPQELN